MPPRIQPVNSEADAVRGILDRIRTLEDTVRERALPPQFVFDTDGSSLVITRLSDNATQVVFP